MKIITSSLFIIFLAGFVNAETFSVGGKDIEIPPPNNFSMVTKEMDALYRFSKQMDDQVNDQLAYYIPESDVPAALSGKILSLKRYYLLKVNKKLKDRLVSSRDFSELKNITRQQNKEVFKSVKKKISGTMKKISKGISDEFDVDFALKVSQIVPFEPHYETDNAFAFSMYINYGVMVKGSKEDIIVSATTTILNVSGKVLFLYCYGSKSELEWTRTASKSWAAKVIDSNLLASAVPSVSGIGRNKVIVSVFTGGLIALIFGVFLIFKKRKNG